MTTQRQQQHTAQVCFCGDNSWWHPLGGCNSLLAAHFAQGRAYREHTSIYTDMGCQPRTVPVSCAWRAPGRGGNHTPSPLICCFAVVSIRALPVPVDRMLQIQAPSTHICTTPVLLWQPLLPCRSTNCVPVAPSKSNAQVCRTTVNTPSALLQVLHARNAVACNTVPYVAPPAVLCIAVQSLWLFLQYTTGA
jgi:hypothetical protein